MSHTHHAVANEPLFAPEQRFWEKYNQFYECPIGSVTAVYAFAFTVFGVLFFTGYQFSRDTSPVSVISLGDDDAGLGTPAEGGEKDPVALGVTPQADLERNIPLGKLPEVKQEMLDRLKLDDSTANLDISDANVAALNALQKDLAEKMLGIGQNKGNNGGPGGGTDTSGSGKGGEGADSTRARGFRWVLAFRTTSGKDYLDQIAALKGVVLVPVPPENKKMMMFRDLKNPKPGDFASDADIGQFTNQIQFSDVRTKSCEAIQEALHLTFAPSAFWAFFPKQLEEQLARLEVAYNNMPSDRIKETKFQVLVVGGQPRLSVLEQKLK